MMASVIAPAISEVCIPNNWQNTSIPTRPYMIDGMPESVSAAYSITRERRLFPAYSVR